MYPNLVISLSNAILLPKSLNNLLQTNVFVYFGYCVYLLFFCIFSVCLFFLYFAGILGYLACMFLYVACIRLSVNCFFTVHFT